MWPKKNQNQGFTLIETIIVLAISAALAIALLSSYTINQRRSRFTDAVERVVSALERVKQEANSAYTTGTGTTPGRIFFAKAVSFTNNQETYTVDTLTADQADTLNDIRLENSQVTESISWGVNYQHTIASYDVILFVRFPGSSQLNVYVMRQLPDAHGVGAPGNYDQDTDTASSQLTFQSPDSPPLRATITVNGATGEISRSYEN